MTSTGSLIMGTTGVAVAGKIAGLDTTGVAGTVVQTGGSLMGMPALMNTTFGKGGIMDAMNDFSRTTRKRRK